MNRGLIKNIVLILVPIIVIALVGIGLVNSGIITTEPLKINTNEVNATLIIDYGNNQVDTYNMKVENPTVFSVLMKASNLYGFEVGAEYYNNYQSNYIYSINNVVEGKNNKFWQYYLNGEYGTVGADLQPINNNDTVKWMYQEPKI